MFVSKIVGCQHGFLNIKSKQTRESEGLKYLLILAFLSKFPPWSFNNLNRLFLRNLKIFTIPVNFTQSCPGPQTLPVSCHGLVLLSPGNTTPPCDKMCTCLSFRFKLMISHEVYTINGIYCFCLIASELSLMNCSNGKIWDRRILIENQLNFVIGDNLTYRYIVGSLMYTPCSKHKPSFVFWNQQHRHIKFLSASNRVYSKQCLLLPWKAQLNLFTVVNKTNDNYPKGVKI